MQLRTRVSLAALATAAALGTTTAILIPAASARPLSTAQTHTLRFTAVEESQTTFSKTLSLAQDKDVDPSGRIVGYDVVRVIFKPGTNTVAISVTIDLPGGFLYGRLTEGPSPVSHGTVCGGSGAYRGATGSITLKALDQNDDRSAVTIAYRT